MNKIKFLTFVSIGLLLVNIGLVAFLLFGRPGRPRQGGPRDLIIERLGFEGQQVTDFEVAINEHRASMKKIDENELAIKEQLFGLLPLAQVPNTTKDSLIQELAKFDKQKQYADFEHFLAIKKICKPEQLPAYNEFTKEFVKIFGRRGRPGGPPPHGH